MNHFMLIMEGYGIRPPQGEAYFASEGANGELGFYVDLRRQRSPVPRALPAAVPAAGGRAAPDDRGGDDRRPRPDLRLREHDRRRARSMSTTPGAPDPGRVLARAARRGARGCRGSIPTSAGRCCRCCTWPRRRSAGSRFRVEEYVAGPVRALAGPRARGRHLLHALLPAAQGPPRRGRLPQPVLLPGGLPGLLAHVKQPARHRARRDHARRPDHAAVGRVPVRVRGGADGAGGRPLRAEPHAREGRPHSREAALMAEKVLMRNFDRADSHTLAGYRARRRVQRLGHRAGRWSRPPSPRS